MRGVSWDNIGMKPIKIEEITPEKLVEIDKRAEEVRLHDLTAKQLDRVARDRKQAEQYFNSVELDCKMRAMRAHTLGFSKTELAKIFDVTPNVIKKWVG